MTKAQGRESKIDGNVSSLKTNSNLLMLTPLDVRLRKLEKKRRQREKMVQTGDSSDSEKRRSRQVTAAEVRRSGPDRRRRRQRMADSRRIQSFDSWMKKSKRKPKASVLKTPSDHCNRQEHQYRATGLVGTRRRDLHGRCPSPEARAALSKHQQRSRWRAVSMSCGLRSRSAISVCGLDGAWSQRRAVCGLDAVRARCWRTDVGGPMLEDRCWSTDAGGPMLR
jgi:hypothetical protein